MSLSRPCQRAVFASLLFFLAEPAAALDGGIGMDYNKGFDEKDPTIGLRLLLNQKLNASWSLFLSQEITKNLVIDSETDEWVIADTRLGAKYVIPKFAESIDLNLNLSATLPVSKESRHAQIITVAQVALNGVYTPSPWCRIKASGFFRDFESAYETTPVEDGEGGHPLPDYAWGASQGMSFENDGFSFGYAASYRETTYYTFDRTETERNDYRNNLPAQGYDIRFYLGGELWDKASLTLSYHQGSALIQEGYEDYVIFDEQRSSWSVGIDQGF